jgi:hypothetical protein
MMLAVTFAPAFAKACDGYGNAAAVSSSCYRQNVRQVRQVVSYEAPVVERVIEKEYYTMPNAVREVRTVERVVNDGYYGNTAAVRSTTRSVGSGVGSASVTTGRRGRTANVVANDGASVDVKFRGLLRNRVSSIRIN